METEEFGRPYNIKTSNNPIPSHSPAVILLSTKTSDAAMRLSKTSTSVTDASPTVSTSQEPDGPNNNNNRNEIIPYARKTIVLDMEKTLIYASFTPPLHYHFTVKLHGLQERPTLCYVQKRPAVDKFLHELSKNYEIIVFTASCKEFADPILNRLDLHKAIDHRLYRDSCTKLHHGIRAKDLSNLGRILENVVIVDDEPENYQFQPENAFPVKPYKGDLSDRELVRALKFCNGAAACNDLREAIHLYNKFNNNNDQIENNRCIAGRKRTIVVELFGTLVKASPDPLALHDFTISRISGHGLSEFSHIVPYYVMKRPGVDEFLAELSKDYEIVVFTEGQKQMVDLILGFLDFDFVIKKRLYRDSCTKGVKDLTKISGEKKRGYLDLKNVVIVDHDPVAWKLQPKNGVLVSRFEGDIHDRELYGLIGFFKDALEFEDVREAITSVKRFGTSVPLC